MVNTMDKITNAAEKKHDPNAKVRNRGDVVFPAGSKSVKDDKDHFPINSESQARNALSRVGQYSAAPSWYSGSLESLKKAVQNAVHRKYPGIKVTKGNTTYSNEAFMMVAQADDGDTGGYPVVQQDAGENTYNGPQKRNTGQPDKKKKKKVK
jgi:hypothetical protein